MRGAPCCEIPPIRAVSPKRVLRLRGPDKFAGLIEGGGRLQFRARYRLDSVTLYTQFGQSALGCVLVAGSAISRLHALTICPNTEHRGLILKSTAQNSGKFGL